MASHSTLLTPCSVHKWYNNVRLRSCRSWRSFKGIAFSSVHQPTVCSLHAFDDQRAGRLGRRSFVLLSVGLLGVQIVQPSLAAVSVPAAAIRPELRPDQMQYDPTDPQLRAAAQLLQQALNAETVQREEALWTELINKYQNVDAAWTADVVGRAYGNRGNARSRQGKLEAAVLDYNKSIEICPWSVDPVLNRGATLEALGRFDEAIKDYRAVLAVAPSDPAAWNNLGNASAGLGNWGEAAQYFKKAVSLAPEFSFAAANQALAEYQLGNTQAAIKEMRALLRRYPEFPDMRAALTAALWRVGKFGDAETNWQRVSDPRYRDLKWLANERRWPPRLRDDLEAFLTIQAAGA